MVIKRVLPAKAKLTAPGRLISSSSSPSGEKIWTPLNEERNGSKLLGRDHHPHSFCVWMAGGGIKPGITYGETDDLARRGTSDPVSVPDLFATMHAALGIDYTKNLYDADRPVPITDGGKPIAALFS